MIRDLIMRHADDSNYLFNPNDYTLDTTITSAYPLYYPYGWISSDGLFLYAVSRYTSTAVYITKVDLTTNTVVARKQVVKPVAYSSVYDVFVPLDDTKLLLMPSSDAEVVLFTFESGFSGNYATGTPYPYTNRAFNAGPWLNAAKNKVYAAAGTILYAYNIGANYDISALGAGTNVATFSESLSGYSSTTMTPNGASIIRFNATSNVTIVYPLSTAFDVSSIQSSSSYTASLAIVLSQDMKNMYKLKPNTSSTTIYKYIRNF